MSIRITKERGGRRFERGDAVNMKRALERRKRAPTNKSLNKKIKKIQDEIELKYKDTYSAATDISTTAQLILVNGIQQGDTAVTRTGGQIRCTSLHIRGTVTRDETSLIAEQYRMIVLWDRQANLLAPSLSGTVASILDVSVVTNPLIAPYNYSALDRFTILRDKRIVLMPKVVDTFTPGTGSTTEYGPIEKKFNNKIKLGRHVKYALNANAGTVADILTNSLYVIFIGDVAPAGANPSLEFSSRLYFKDA